MMNKVKRDLEIVINYLEVALSEVESAWEVMSSYPSDPLGENLEDIIFDLDELVERLEQDNDSSDSL